MRVNELKPGYEIYNESFDMTGVVAAVTEHPSYPGFALVIWWLPEQNAWSFDCLSFRQEVGDLCTTSRMANLRAIFKPRLDESTYHPLRREF